MKIDNIVTSADDNPLYQSYWPYFAKVWSHFGFNPILLWLTTSEGEYPFPSSIGRVIRITPIPGVDIVWQAQIIRLIGLAAIEGVNLSGDIDLFPIAQSYVDLYLPIPNKSLAVRTDITTILRSRRFGAAGIAGSYELFQEIFAINGVSVSLQDDFWNETLLSQMQAIPIPKGEWAGCIERKPGFDELWFYRAVTNMWLLFEKSIGIFSINGASSWNVFSNRRGAGDFITPSLEEFGETFRPITDIVNTFHEVHYGRDRTKEVTSALVSAILEASK